MNKPSDLSFVRTCPEVSGKSLEVEEKKRGKNPPGVPPQRVALDLDPIPLEVRQLRVVNGSRRKRDLAAVRMTEELEQLERLGMATAEARAAFAQLAIQCWRALPESTFAIWLSPLQLAGVDGSTLLLTAPDGISTWVDRRYSPLIREALEATGSGYTDVEFVSVGEEATCP